MEKQYEKLMQYALSGEKLGEDFFASQLLSLRHSVEERQLHIKLRKRVHYEVLEEIEQERLDKEAQLLRMAASYSSERLTMMKHLESLAREARTERIRLVSDLANFSKEARQKLEEYEALAQTFKTAAMTTRGGPDE